MFKGPRRTLLLLSSAVLITLVLGHFLRGMIVKDFQRHLVEERMDRVRLVASDLEGSYAAYRSWNREDTARDAVRALMLGLTVRLTDAGGNLVMDAQKALSLLPPEKKAQVLAAAGFNAEGNSAAALSYPLVAAGERVGSLEVIFPGREKENVFIRRSRAIALAFSFLLAAPAFCLGIVISRKPAGEIRKTVQTASSRKTVLNEAVQVPVKDETAGLPQSGTVMTSPVAAGSSIAVSEEEPEAVPDDEPLDTDDEDMRPLAGDAGRITKIVKGLEELAKAQALRSSLHKQPLEVAQVLNTIIEMTRGSIRDKNVLFNLECGSDLRLSADPMCLTGIMTHLLDNAAKAVKNDGTVTVSAVAEGDYVLFAVKDTGTGIRRKDIPHLFERFFRASGSGIGLGLTIVKELVDACGGTIKVETTRGKGSVVTVRIPERIG
jgi:signal transduction histidine kinase